MPVSFSVARSSLVGVLFELRCRFVADFGFLLSAVGSSIGSIAAIKEMLALCAAKNIAPMIELFPLKDVNQAIETVRKNTIRFRAVLTVDEARDFAGARL